MQKKNKRGAYIVIALIVIAVVSVYLYGRMESERIDKKPMVSYGNVDRIFTARGYNGISIEYSFVYGGKIYKDSRGMFFLKERARYLGCLLNQYTWPIVFEKDHPSNSTILLLTSDFKRFNLALGDSLKNVVNYMDSVVDENVSLNYEHNPCNDLHR